jgi:hypothetical protein
VTNIPASVADFTSPGGRASMSLPVARLWTTLDGRPSPIGRDATMWCEEAAGGRWFTMGVPAVPCADRTGHRIRSTPEGTEIVQFEDLNRAVSALIAHVGGQHGAGHSDNGVA